LPASAASSALCQQHGTLPFDEGQVYNIRMEFVLLSQQSLCTPALCPDLQLFKFRLYAKYKTLWDLLHLHYCQLTHIVNAL
jgi:hypothetical protein